MESNRDMRWYLHVDCACNALSFPMDAMLAFSCCLLLALFCYLSVYLNVVLRLSIVPRERCMYYVTYLNLSSCFLTLLKVVVIPT